MYICLSHTQHIKEDYILMCVIIYMNYNSLLKILTFFKVYNSEIFIIDIIACQNNPI